MTHSLALRACIYVFNYVCRVARPRTSDGRGDCNNHALRFIQGRATHPTRVKAPWYFVKLFQSTSTHQRFHFPDTLHHAE
ncbi:hypothetical protein Pan54_29540 [Rubinisphaera italica]|uniref:Uncharacterized protein n=1 Tax=Rubinisphaera italica TaxID=2527969 RepID=A0A5C5XIR9_9PLAN|nr:hypothetical protein Pan54_29540 [Rubinisphaera italica]